MTSSCESARLKARSRINTASLLDTLCNDELSLIVGRLNGPLKQPPYPTLLGFLESVDLSLPNLHNSSESVRFLAKLFSRNSCFRDPAASFVSTIELSRPLPQTSIDLGAKVLKEHTLRVWTICAENSCGRYAK